LKPVEIGPQRVRPAPEFSAAANSAPILVIQPLGRALDLVKSRALISAGAIAAEIATDDAQLAIETVNVLRESGVSLKGNVRTRDVRFEPLRGSRRGQTDETDEGERKRHD
jgi:hypothetical protein